MAMGTVKRIANYAPKLMANQSKKKPKPETKDERGILRAHLDAHEAFLVAGKEIQEQSGHTLHKGTPREFFVRQFLSSHLGSGLALGTGEIIDQFSARGERRNQCDIVIHSNVCPKLHFGGGVDAFLAESVVATVEVKSTLTQEDLSDALSAVAAIKKQYRGKWSHTRSPNVQCYVVAFDGPKKMKTVIGWLKVWHQANHIKLPVLPPKREDRIYAENPSIDGIFVLGKGFVYFDNKPGGYLDEGTRGDRKVTWCHHSGPTANLFTFFMAIATNDYSREALNGDGINWGGYSSGSGLPIETAFEETMNLAEQEYFERGMATAAETHGLDFPAKAVPTKHAAKKKKADSGKN